MTCSDKKVPSGVQARKMFTRMDLERSELHEVTGKLSFITVLCSCW